MPTIDFLIALASALGLGLLIGLERQWGQHPAGMRTNALVCAGAAVYVLLGRAIGHETETGRVAAQIVSGVGFLGGGVILREGLTVRGLTSAATLWCAAAVGTLCGAALLREACLATFGILATNSLLNPASRWIDRHAAQRAIIETTYRLKVVCAMAEERRIRHVVAERICAHKDMILRSIGIHANETADRGIILADVEMRLGDQHFLQDLVAELNADPSTTSVSWERHA